MKSLMLFLDNILDEIRDECGIESTSMDRKTIHRRVEDEGLSFLTITLPQFCKDLEKGLEQGYVDRRLFTGFKHRGEAELPLFLGAFLGLIFNRSSGYILDEPSEPAIRGLRQLTSMFSKILMPVNEHRNKQAMLQFVQTDQEVREADLQVSEAQKASFSCEFRFSFSGTSSTRWSIRSTWDLMSLSTWLADWTLVPYANPGYARIMALALQQIDFEETRSGFRLSGPAGLSMSFQVESFYSHPGRSF